MPDVKSDFRKFPYFSILLCFATGIWVAWNLLTTDYSPLVGLLMLFLLCVTGFVTLFGMFVFGLMVRAWLKS